MLVRRMQHARPLLLLAMGVHVKIVAEMLGHSQVSLCLDTYSHVLPSIQEEAVNKLNTLLSKEG
jgi:integrase